MHYSVAYIFWVLFLVPGFALVMRTAPGLTRGGLMCTLATSFLGTVALLMPVTIVGYFVNMPVAVISTLLVIALIAGLIDIVRQGHWRMWKEQGAGILRLESLVIAAGFYIHHKIGSLMGADALIHMARVRQFLDHGLTNVDPFIKGDHFYPIYHTNVYHVILAAASQLSQVHYLDIWFGALPVFLVLIASAMFFMTWQVFQNRWAAWFAAIFFVVDQGHINFLTYPNKIAPFFLLPVLIGLTVRALREKPTTRHAVQIGVVSLALGMFHGMYAFFGAILLGPVFLALGLRSHLKKEGALKKYALCVLALMVSLPWPVISRRAQDATRKETIRARILRDRNPDAIQFVVTDAGKRKPKKNAQKGVDAFFLDVGAGMIMKKPFRGFGGGRGLFGIRGFRYQYLMLGLILGIFSRRRKTYLIAASVSLVTLTYLLFPPLCTLLFNIMEAKWMIQRLETAGLSMMFPTLVFGPIVFHMSRLLPLTKDAALSRRIRVVLVQGVISLLLLMFAFSYSNQWRTWHAWIDGSPWRRKIRSWYENYNYVRHTSDLNLRAKVRAMKRQRKFYQEKIPPGSNVIVTDNLALELVTLHDAHILDPIRSSVGVPDLSYLRRLNKRVIDPQTDWETRKRILQQVGARIYLPQTRSRWLDGHIKAKWGMKKGRIKLIEIDLGEKGT